MSRPRQPLRRCRKTRHWRIGRPPPRTAPPTPAARKLRSTGLRGQTREDGRRGWQALDDPGRSVGRRRQHSRLLRSWKFLLEVLLEVRLEVSLWKLEVDQEP